MTKIDQEEQKEASGISAPVIASSNGFRISYGAHQLIVKGEDVESAQVEIFTTDGRLVERSSVALHHGTTRIQVDHLPTGFYVARATDVEGNRIGCKFMK
jgi:hypothetical protein